MGTLYRGLVVNSDFRATFSQRAHQHFDPGGALSEANVMARYVELRDEMLAVRPAFITYIEDTFISAREAIVISALTAEGLY